MDTRSNETYGIFSQTTNDTRRSFRTSINVSTINDPMFRESLHAGNRRSFRAYESNDVVPKPRLSSDFANQKRMDELFKDSVKDDSDSSTNSLDTATPEFPSIMIIYAEIIDSKSTEDRTSSEIRKVPRVSKVLYNKPKMTLIEHTRARDSSVLENGREENDEFALKSYGNALQLLKKFRFDSEKDGYYKVEENPDFTGVEQLSLSSSRLDSAEPPKKYDFDYLDYENIKVKQEFDVESKCKLDHTASDDNVQLHSLDEQNSKSLRCFKIGEQNLISEDWSVRKDVLGSENVENKQSIVVEQTINEYTKETLSKDDIDQEVFNEKLKENLIEKLMFKMLKRDDRFVKKYSIKKKNADCSNEVKRLEIKKKTVDDLVPLAGKSGKYENKGADLKNLNFFPNLVSVLCNKSGLTKYRKMDTDNLVLNDDFIVLKKCIIVNVNDIVDSIASTIILRDLGVVMLQEKVMIKSAIVDVKLKSKKLKLLLKRKYPLLYNDTKHLKKQ